VSRLVCSHCGAYVDLAVNTMQRDDDVECCKACGTPTEDAIGEDE
jgi:DNA-directed RNA polymerase subunit RPC12/RpoP